jgi:glycosyltransferase 2 family protein
MKNNRSISTINWKLWAGLLLSALFLYLAFRQVDIGKTGSILASSNYIILLPAALITIIQYIIRTLRWELFLCHIQKTGFKNRLLSIFTGFAANCVLPARLGEFVRANALGEIEQISKSAVFGTLVVERLFDGFIMLIIIIIGLVSTTFPPEYSYIIKRLRWGALIVFCGVVLAIVVIAVIRLRSEIFQRIIDRAFSMFSDATRKKINLIIDNFFLGLSPVKGLKPLVKALLWSIILWGLSLCQIHLVGMATGIRLPFISTFIIMGFLFVGVAVPSAPGFIGAFHLAGQYAYMVLGLSPEAGLSAATLLHILFFIPTVLIGVLAFTRLQTACGRINISKKINRNGISS